jgi:hypothetical protein
MDLSTHKRLLGILHLIYGAFVLLFIVGIKLLSAVFFPFIIEEITSEFSYDSYTAELITSIFDAVFIILILIIPVPSLIGGIAILNDKKWAMIPLLISGCLSLLSFPLGTLLGAYTLWFYIQNSNQKHD